MSPSTDIPWAEVAVVAAYAFGPIVLGAILASLITLGHLAHEAMLRRGAVRMERLKSPVEGMLQRPPPAASRGIDHERAPGWRGKPAFPRRPGVTRLNPSRLPK